MLLKSSGVAALVAASAPINAFLIPHQLSNVDNINVEIIEAAPIVSKTSEEIAVKVKCPECSFHMEGEADVTPPSHLELSFSIDHQQSDRLLVNGFELYPSADPFQSLYALQVLDDDKEEKDVKGLPRKLGYSLQIQPRAKDDEGKPELILVDLQIIQVGDVFVNSDLNVRARLIKNRAEGRLSFERIETTVFESQETTDGGEEGEKCTTMMCKWIAYTQEKMRQMKNSVRPKPCHGNGMAKGWRMGHHGGPGSAHRAHGHHGYGSNGEGNQRPPHFNHSTNPPSIGKLFKNIASHILLPVFIGVIAGVSVSL